MPLRVQEVCLALPRDDGAVTALCSASSLRQQPPWVLQGLGREEPGSEGDFFHGGCSSFCLLREQGTVTSSTETATRRGCKDQGAEERSRGPLGPIACSAYVNIWLPFRDEREEAQRDRTVSSQLPSFLLPSPIAQPWQCCQIPPHGTPRP